MQARTKANSTEHWINLKGNRRAGLQTNSHEEFQQSAYSIPNNDQYSSAKKSLKMDLQIYGTLKQQRDSSHLQAPGTARPF